MSEDAVSMSFTLELSAPETMPEVLAEYRRVLATGRRPGVASMATVLPAGTKIAQVRTDVPMQTNFPNIVDCQPILLDSLLEFSRLQPSIAQANGSVHDAGRDRSGNLTGPRDRRGESVTAIDTPTSENL